MKPSEYFLTAYVNSEFILKQRALTLLYFNLVLIMVLPVLLAALNLLAERPLFSLLNIMILALITGMALSLVFLKKGMYLFAANATILFAIFSFTLYSFFGKMAFNNGAIWGTCHFIIFIVFTSLFSGRRMASVSSSFSNNAQNKAASAEEITATVEEISAGVENVADSAKYQLDRMNLLMSSINRLSESIKTLDLDVDEATSLAEQVNHEARSGENVMLEMNESMNNIGSSSTQMSGIVSIINDISDRINLLSLNASIEAARAGDAGRGFAVVADEISKLADQTSSSVKDIDSLIKETGGYIASGMTSVQTTVKTISSIIKGITAISDKIKVIRRSMLEQLETNTNVNDESITVKTRSDEIFRAATEQKHAANEIVKSISVINELTQANATGSEQIAGNSEMIAGLAEKLKERVETFEVE